MKRPLTRCTVSIKLSARSRRGTPLPRWRGPPLSRYRVSVIYDIIYSKSLFLTLVVSLRCRTSHAVRSTQYAGQGTVQFKQQRMAG